MELMPLFYKDVYKSYHPFAYAPNVEFVYGNFTPRFGKHSNIKNGTGMVFVGLQAVVIEYLMRQFTENFFNKPAMEVCAEYARVVSAVVGKPVPTDHILALHTLGYLPIKIKALKEGSFVPYGVPAYTITNTVKGFGWLVNSLETLMSAQLWSVCTSATTAREYFKVFTEAAELTGMDKGMLPFLGHDFSYRGLPGTEAAALSGFGHLASGFAGSDTYPAGLFAEKYYNVRIDQELVMASVDATEHSVMCSYGNAGELDSLVHLITKVTPTGIISIVSDTWDFWKLVTEYLPAIKDIVMAREGTLVIRPDSGDPVKILTGYTVHPISFGSVEDFYAELDYEICIPEAVKVAGKYYEALQDVDGRVALGQELSEAEVKGLIECLWDTFGGTVNDKGFKQLDSHIGAIYGDSITLERQRQILDRLIAKKFVPQVVLGIGSFTYQYVTRDTHGTAIKATHMIKNGVPEDMFKAPKTDSSKRSAKGLLRVERENGTFVLYDEQTPEQEAQGELSLVFEDGKMYRQTNLQAIRAEVAKTF